MIFNAIILALIDGRYPTGHVAALCGSATLAITPYRIGTHYPQKHTTCDFSYEGEKDEKKTECDICTSFSFPRELVSSLVNTIFSFL
jgi:hypothetical protein